MWMHVARLYIKISISLAMSMAWNLCNMNQKCGCSLHSVRDSSVRFGLNYVWLFIVHFFSLFSFHLCEPFCLAFKFLANFFHKKMTCHVARISPWDSHDKNRTPNIYIVIIDFSIWFFHYLIVPSYSTELTINWNLPSHLPFPLSLFTYHPRLCPESIYSIYPKIKT